MKILLATDGSADAQHALELLCSLRFAPGTGILVLSVVPARRDSDPPRAGRIDPEETEARQTVRRATRGLAKTGVGTESMVRRGHPVESVCRVAQERKMDLVVAGSRGRSAIARFLQGSVSRQLLAYCPVSVLIARPPARAIRKVLVGLDGSEGSRAAAAFLSRLPLAPSTEVTLLSVVSRPAWPVQELESKELANAAGAMRRMERGDARSLALRAAERLGKSFAVDVLVEEGNPSQVLLEMASRLESDLIVLGSRVMTRAERLLLGSVSYRVGLQSPRSVLVVRGP